jgi:quercetin dioxygenase-like cupin family protein
MQATRFVHEITRLVPPGTHCVLDIFGPTVEFLTSPAGSDGDYCVMIGTIPPGVSVPLHSHPDPESFYLLSGAVRALSQRDDHFEWLNVKPGEFVHEPSGVKHAFLGEPAVPLITTTSKLGRFVQEIGRPVTPGTFPAPPTSDDLQRLMRVSAKYDHWVGSPAENAVVGINLSW